MRNAAKNQPAINILYIPGGGYLGLIPAMILQRLERLTETGANDLFPVKEGVSTGAIIAGGLAMGLTAYDCVELYKQEGPNFFKDIPGRESKMITASGLNLAKIFMGLHPRRTDKKELNDIQKHLQRLRENTKPGTPERDNIELLGALSTRQWLTKRDINRVLKIYENIRDNEALRKDAKAIVELTSLRTSSGELGKIFKKSARSGIDFILNRYAKDYLYDPEIPKKVFQTLFGDKKISDCRGSLYLSAQNNETKKSETFFARKKDLLYSSRENDEVQNDMKMWDALMASISLIVAYPDHITEDLRIWGDKAIAHRIQSVEDILENKSEDAKVRLIILPAGDVLEQDVNEMPEQTCTEEERLEKLLEIQREDQELGMIGGIITGKIANEIDRYVSSQDIAHFEKKLGKDNVIRLSPRLAPLTREERDSFPSTRPDDASRENTSKIIRRVRAYLSEPETDKTVRELAQSLIDNQYLLGQIDKDKYMRVSKKIGIREPDTKEAQKLREKYNEEDLNVNGNGRGIIFALRHPWKAAQGYLSTQNNTTPPSP